jgi:thymidylate synthase ThyX
MQPSAKVICDSISESGNRLTTIEIQMHRFVLAEFNTHRAFSRNSASSRAIPVEKQIKKVLEDPAIPLSWGKNQKGMQAEEELSKEDAEHALKAWLLARDAAVACAYGLMDLKVHKQITNRLLEPFQWHTAIVSATEWDNFFKQRCSPLAQPEIQAVAYAIRDAINSSTPKELKYGDWHLPYIDFKIDGFGLSIHSDAIENLKKISVARCARVSYMTHLGVRSMDEDLSMYERLATATPPHMSPFEHVATPYGTKLEDVVAVIPKGNFNGWHQLRHMVFGE